MSTNASLVSASQDGAIDLAVEKILGGDVVALPTETVYGLAASAKDKKAVANIFAVKGRPSFNPLICHVSSIAMAEAYVDFPPLAQKLAGSFWPGPLTIVCKTRPKTGLAEKVSAGLDTLAVRCPDSHIMRQIIEGVGHPLAAPSANKSGRLSPTTAQSVEAGLGEEIPLIIDAGPTTVGIESTIVSVIGSDITLLRPGVITTEQIENAAGQPVLMRNSKTINAPGQLLSHYAPKATLHLNQQATEGRTHIGFGKEDADLNLSASGDLKEAAKNLFETLRKADAISTGEISVSPIPDVGIGMAINDRLKRAAAPRPDPDYD